MLDLYLSELRRFRTGAAIYAVATLLVLTLLSQLTELAAAPRELHQLFYLLVMLSGLGFAAYQFVTYRQPSRWIWLQHRPMHRARILAAIGLASATLILLALALPMFLVLASQDHFTLRVVDQRHYAGVAFLVLSALSAWLAGAYMVLHRSRWAFVILLLPLLLTMHMAAWTTILALSVLCNVLLVFLVYTVFRPNRSTGADATATVASAVPLAASFFLALLWGGSTVFQVGQMLFGVHPLNGDHVPRGGFVEAARMEDREVMLAGLATSTDPRAPAWRAALNETNNANVGPDVRQFAVRGGMSTQGNLGFQEGAVRWTFSDDRMQFKGLQARTRQPQGWFGPAGAGDTQAFDSQPEPVRDNRRQGYMVTVQNLYASAGNAKLQRVLHVDGGEQLTGGVAVFDGQSAYLTSRRLILRPTGSASAQRDISLPLPLPFADLARAQVAQVDGGTLVSFVYGRRMVDGFGNGMQATWFVDAAGQVREVARRGLTHDFPVLFEHKAWWLSPALDALVSLPSLLVDNGTVGRHDVNPMDTLLRPRPTAAWVAMLCAALAAGIGAWVWTRSARVSPRARAVWCVASVLAGPPALLALMVLHPRELRDVQAAAARPQLTTAHA